MKLENRSPFPARVLTANFGEPELRDVVIVKATYDVGPDGQTTPSAAPMPILVEPLETAFGIFHGEHHFKQDGADVCILGSIRRTKAHAEVMLTLKIGAYATRLRAIGDRAWVDPKDPAKSLGVSVPTPFKEMPISYRRAFGGVTEVNHEQSAWPDNPLGLGYYFTREQAIGKPLPNLESTDEPIAKWDDRPKPASWGPYPMFWGMRGVEGVTANPKTYQVDCVRPRIFNNAHPKMILPELKSGDTMMIDGIRDQPIACRIPAATPAIEIEVGDRVWNVASRIDAASWWVDQNKLVILHRANFRHIFRPNEPRQVTVAM